MILTTEYLFLNLQKLATCPGTNVRLEGTVRQYDTITRTHSMGVDTVDALTSPSRSQPVIGSPQIQSSQHNPSHMELLRKQFEELDQNQNASVKPSNTAKGQGNLPSTKSIETYPSGAKSKFHERLRKHWKVFINDLEPDELIAHLYQEDVITGNQKEILKRTDLVRHQIVEKLLDMMMRKDKKAMLEFTQGLREYNHEHLAKLLEKD